MPLAGSREAEADIVLSYGLRKEENGASFPHFSILGREEGEGDMKELVTISHSKYGPRIETFSARDHDMFFPNAEATLIQCAVLFSLRGQASRMP
ncbi:hypothetical protein NMY22_g4788 [Coprinellus aureogranulatus]|nr:hypothetical protein NMY22_g4788 [Coprinellus aureogranulatus]